MDDAAAEVASRMPGMSAILSVERRLAERLKDDSSAIEYEYEGGAGMEVKVCRILSEVDGLGGIHHVAGMCSWLWAAVLENGMLCRQHRVSLLCV